MELSTILIIAAALGCPIAMGFMLWMMNKNMGGDSHQSMSSTDPDRLKALREKRQILDQEIAELQKITELEEKKEALTRRTGAIKSPSDSHSGSG
jgi:DNA-binding transcriptional MerR regulator